jgi:6-phosphogluconolactonase
MTKSTSGVTVSEPGGQIRRLHLYPDRDRLWADVVERIQHLANECIRLRDTFRIVLAGGNTPRDIYRDLKNIDTDWRAWTIFFGDERCLPTGDAGRNDTMAMEAWLARVSVPRDQIHSIPAELGAEAGARAYGRLLANIDRFDLVLLGMGEDGHTASLFPGRAHDAGDCVVAVHDAPKAPPDRISLGSACLARGEQVWFLVSGEAKREALQRWLAGANLPVNLVRPAHGVDIFSDIAIEANR